MWFCLCYHLVTRSWAYNLTFLNINLPICKMKYVLGLFQGWKLQGSTNVVMIMFTRSDSLMQNHDLVWIFLSSIHVRSICTGWSSQTHQLHELFQHVLLKEGAGTSGTSVASVFPHKGRKPVPPSLVSLPPGLLGLGRLVEVGKTAF